MKAIRVQYTVKDDFVETNHANVRAVMEELRGKGNVGVKYTTFVLGDGRTFVHVAIHRDEAAADIIPSLPAFHTFRTALKDNVEVPPSSEEWTVVGTSYDV